MGRLFWKLFLAIWLAQVLTAVVVGALLEWRHRTMTEAGLFYAAGPVLTPGASAALESRADDRFPRPAANGSVAGFPSAASVGEPPSGTDPAGTSFNAGAAQPPSGAGMPKRHVAPGMPGGHSASQPADAVSEDGAPGAVLRRHALGMEGPRVLRHLEPPPFLDDMPGPPEHLGLPLPPRGPRHGLFSVPLVPFLVGLLSSLLLAALLARHLTRPIAQLREAFADLAQGRFAGNVAQRIGRRTDELGELGRDFDRTATQLKALLDGRRRLLHDVSHEVRSPLARIQLAIDLAEQDPSRTEQSLERIGRESRRIDVLVGELLMLSRLEARELPLRQEPLDLAELAGELVADAAFEAEGRRIVVQQHGPTRMPYRGDEELLHRALENLLRNAIRHAPDGTAVTVGLQAQADALRITVEDHGPGLPEAALEVVFEPFTRVGGQVGSDGYGLGLAIARRTIEAHGGSIVARNREEGGLRVEIQLPVLPGELSGATAGSRS